MFLNAEKKSLVNGFLRTRFFCSDYAGVKTNEKRFGSGAPLCSTRGGRQRVSQGPVIYIYFFHERTVYNTIPVRSTSRKVATISCTPGIRGDVMCQVNMDELVKFSCNKELSVVRVHAMLADVAPLLSCYHGVVLVLLVFLLRVFRR